MLSTWGRLGFAGPTQHVTPLSPQGAWLPCTLAPEGAGRTPHSQPRPQPWLWGTPAEGTPAGGEIQEPGGWRGGTLQAWAGAPGLPHWLGAAPPQGLRPCGEQGPWRGREASVHRNLEQSRGAREHRPSARPRSPVPPSPGHWKDVHAWRDA